MTKGMMCVILVCSLLIMFGLVTDPLLAQKWAGLAVAWSPTQPVIAIANAEGTAIRFYNPNFTLVSQLCIRNVEPIATIATVTWSPDGTKLAIVMNDAGGDTGRKITVWQFNPQQKLSEWRDITGSIVEWSPDSRYIAVNRFYQLEDSDLIILDTVTTQEVKRWKPQLGLEYFAWHPDGTQGATGGTQVTLWNMMTTPPNQIGLLGQMTTLPGLEFNADGTRIAFVSNISPKNIEIWNTQTLSHISTLTGHTHIVDRIVWGNHDLMSVAFDSTTRIWDIDLEKEKVTVFTGLTGNLSWSPDGTQFVALTQDETVYVRDAHTGTILSQFNPFDSAIPTSTPNHPLPPRLSLHANTPDHRKHCSRYRSAWRGAAGFSLAAAAGSEREEKAVMKTGDSWRSPSHSPFMNSDGREQRCWRGDNVILYEGIYIRRVRQTTGYPV